MMTGEEMAVTGAARNATGQCPNRLGKTGVDLLCQKFCRLTLVHLMCPEEANLSLSCRPDCSWGSGWALQPVAAASRALRVCVAVLHESALGSLEIIKLNSTAGPVLTPMPADACHVL